MPRIMKTRELAEAFGVSIMTLFRWKARGLIRPIRQVEHTNYYDFDDCVARLQAAPAPKRGPKVALSFFLRRD